MQQRHKQRCAALRPNRINHRNGEHAILQRSRAAGSRNEATAMLNQQGDSAGTMTPELAVLTTDGDTQPLALGLEIHRARLFGFSAFMLVVIISLTISFHHGFSLAHFDSRDKNATERTKLLDHYNAYTGSVSSIFASPVQLSVTVSVQLIVLRFMADLFTRPEMSRPFNAVNVQLRPQAIHNVISNVDLGRDNAVVYPSSSFIATSPLSVPELRPQNAVNNTVLRSVLVPIAEIVVHVCTYSNVRGGQNMMSTLMDQVDRPYLNLGLAHREWQSRILQEALPSETLRLIVNPTDTAINDGINTSALPMDAARAAMLFHTAMVRGRFFFPWGDRLGYVNKTDLLQRYSVNDSAEHNILAPLPQVNGLLPMNDSDEATQRAFLIPAMLAAASRQFANASRTKTSDIVMEFTHTQISPTITFDALALEVELDPTLLATMVSDDNATRYTVLNQRFECPMAQHCFVPKPTYTAMPQFYDPPAQVVAYRMCLNQNDTETLDANVIIQNNTIVQHLARCYGFTNVTQVMRIMSIGKRLVADALAQNVSVSAVNGTTRNPNATTITNLRKIYTFTIGRLGWDYTHLGKTFNAQCEADGADCRGLELPLSAPLSSSTTVTNGASQRLVVGREAVRLSQTVLNLETSRVSYDKKTLVVVAEPPQLSNASSFYRAMAGDLLLPDNVRSITWNLTSVQATFDTRTTKEDTQRRVAQSKAKTYEGRVDRGTQCLTLLSQNVRGLAKREAVVQTWLTSFKRHHHGRQVDVIFLQETRAQASWADKLRDAHARARGYEPSRLEHPLSFWQEPERPAGGVAILLHPKAPLTEVQPLWQDEWTLEFMALTGTYEGSNVTLVNIYASSDSKVARDRLFGMLKTKRKPSGLLFVGGDFNCVLDRELDRSRITSTKRETDELQALLDEWHLHDATTEQQVAVLTEADKREFHAAQHTYRHSVDAEELASSRWYVSTPALKRIAQLEVTPPLCTSDHDAVWLNLTEPTPPRLPRRVSGRQSLRYPMQADEVDLTIEVAKARLEAMAAAMTAATPEETAKDWDRTKRSINQDTRKALSDKRRRIRRAYRQRKRQLRAALRSAQLVLNSVESVTEAMEALTLDRPARWKAIRDEIVRESEAYAKRRRNATFAQYAGNGADATKAFYRRINTKFNSSGRVRLQPDPTKPSDPAKRLAHDWRPITQQPELDTESQSEFFARLPPPRATVKCDGLDNAFSEAEVRAAIEGCPRGKAGGPDGIPNDWYRDNVETVAPLLTVLYNSWHHAGTLPMSFRKATIFCFPKVSTPTSGLDFRPIALLNSDYKIYSRLLLTRISQQLPRLVSESQCGFVPGRQVHDAIDIWTAVSKLVAEGKAPTSTTAVLLDFAKAYDTLDRRFLALALRRLRFPEHMIQAIETLHLATTAQYLAEGRLSSEEAVLNGIRQGCPLAPVLFILAVDTLYSTLDANTCVPGVQLSTGEIIKAAGFADDTTVYMAHPRGSEALSQVLERFASVSRLRVNLGKCHAVSFSATEAGHLRDGVFPALACGQMARMLGTQVGCTHQTEVHGSFDFHGLLQARICGDDILHGPSGGPLGPRDFPELPAVLAPHDPIDYVRVHPATIDEWRLQPDGTRFRLLWEPSNGLQVDLGVVSSPTEVTARVRKTLDDPTARAHPHRWLEPLRSIWNPQHEVFTKKRVGSAIRAAKTTRGKLDLEARARKLIAEDEDIGLAMQAMTWADIDKLRATTSRQRLQLRRIKANRVSGWDRLTQRFGCPHCTGGREGGTISHIFWACPAAQELWQVLEDGWARQALWDGSGETRKQLKRAAFGLRVPRTPRRLWQLPRTARVSIQDTTAAGDLHATVETAWQQTVLDTISVIWKWRHRIEDGRQQWSSATASDYLRSVLRPTVKSLHIRLRTNRGAHDSRVQVVDDIALGFNASDRVTTAETRPETATAQRILFFDGGSRGNPGPDGAGAVIVETDGEAASPKVVWSACMSYARRDMTNNRAEYGGLLAGLREAKRRGWAVEVVGDSSLILGQLKHYRQPRHPTLRPLYNEARRLADLLEVNVWQHHLRAFNKMADTAANVAMDRQQSFKTDHPNAWLHAARIESHLQTDYEEWLKGRHLRAQSLRDTIALSSTTKSLAFQRNSQQIKVWVSTPLQNMWLTLADCFVLVVGLCSVVVKTVWFSQNDQDALAHITEPNAIARVMMDECRYPPLFLHRRVVEKDHVASVDDFAIAALSLQQQQESDAKKTRGHDEALV